MDAPDNTRTAESTGADSPPSDRPAAGASGFDLRRLLSGFSWNIAGQALVVGISVGLTPFLLHHLGAAVYGAFALASSVRGLLSSLDGGLAPAGYRYFPIYVGSGDVRATTGLLLTMVALVTVVVGLLGVAVFILAPTVAAFFSLGGGLRGHAAEETYAIRALMPALLAAAVRTPFQRLVMAHHRWAFVNYTQVGAVIAYAGTAIALASVTVGLRCLVWATYAQEAVLLVSAVWACRRYVSLGGLQWLPPADIRGILRFARRIQISALASSINFEVDAFLVGFLFPIRDLAYYSIGANFSQQAVNVPYTGLNPLMQDIGHAFARDGSAGVVRSFASTQRAWVKVLGIFPVVVALIAWFGIPTWLGHGSHLAAATAAILVLGSSPLLFSAIVDITAKVVGLAEIESWYLGIGVLLNIACTIPLALWIGVLGIPVGTAIGQLASFVVCIRLAKSRIGSEIAGFHRSLCYAPMLTGIAVSAVLEWGFNGTLPHGGLGLILAGLLAVPGFVIYYAWVYWRPLRAMLCRPSAP